MKQPFTPPKHNAKAFNCPHCNAYANQNWHLVYYQYPFGGYAHETSLDYVVCAHCGKFSLWKNGKIIDPESAPAPLPNPDLPDEISKDYLDARSIIAKSPRGAAALLRLCVQKLCKHLSESGKDLNADIASLVKKGLNPTIQRSLDIVRVIGNEAVHPGQIDLRDKADTAAQLCHLINIITETMITQPKMVEELYSQLPDTKRQQIKDRDNDK